MGGMGGGTGVGIENNPQSHMPIKETYARRVTDRRGYFIVVDGLDGIGKGEIERALIEYEQKLGRTTFDAVSWSRAKQSGLPELKDFWNPPSTYFNTIMTAEPTYAGIGHIIRFELIARNGRDYSAEIQTQAYSLDRLVQMNKLVIPALQNDVRVIQSRCFASTLAYQSLVAQKEGKDPEEVRARILEHEGNKLQMLWNPDLLIIPTINNINKVIERIKERRELRKDDNAIFDDIEFQGKLKPFYESDWMRETFEKIGTKVAYIDAGISVPSSKNQAGEIYRAFLDTGDIPENYKDIVLYK